jgi:modulator of FtsH protease
LGRAYDPGAWQPFFEAVVAAAAALLGLLFVAASVRVAVVTDSPRHRARAREALGQLLVLVIVGVLVLVPGQSRHVLGAELLILGGVVGAVTVRLQTNTLQRLPPELRRGWLVRDLTYDVGVVSIAIAGLGLVIGSLGGLYWLVVTVVVFFVWSSLQAWSLLIEAPPAPKT